MGLGAEMAGYRGIERISGFFIQPDLQWFFSPVSSPRLRQIELVKKSTSDNLYCVN